MNIQIYGKNKCFDTKKAERYFKERGVKFQRIDVAKYGMSAGELQSVKRAVGSLEASSTRRHKRRPSFGIWRMKATERKNF